MRIGIVPSLRGSDGGVYQYSLSMLRTLYELEHDKNKDEFIVFSHDVHRSSVMSLNGCSWTVNPIQPFTMRQLVRNMLIFLIGEERLSKGYEWFQYKVHREAILPDPDVVQLQPHIRQRFIRNGVELMLYPKPNTLSFETEIPYVMAIHDLQHRLQPDFPEVSANGIWEWREYLFRNGIRYATLILADSEVGKEDILSFYGSYGITSDRVKVLPFLPACYLGVDISESQKKEVQATYHLPDRYLFYPAQFWPHKNHARIIQALDLLKREYQLGIPIVLCGSYTDDLRKRTFNEVKGLVNKYGLEKYVHYLGFVPDKDMSALYSGAVALIMPTFFGPTNIPVLEAWAFSCPVITSDIRGIREQAGDAAILVDPRSVEAIADGIYRLWTDEALAHKLSANGRQRLASYTPEDYRRLLIKILNEAKMRALSDKRFFRA